MILEKEKITDQENKTEELSFLDLVNLKKYEYRTKHFNKISYEEKAAFANKNRKDVYTIPEILIGLTGVLICLLSWSAVELGKVPISFTLPFIFGVMALIPMTYTPIFKKVFMKKWLAKETSQSFLESDMFFSSVVTDDVLKAFVKEYGENELVALLYGKEHLTYSELYSYLLDDQSREERMKLTEAVKCLVNK